jgi:hypothetical protein
MASQIEVAQVVAMLGSAYPNFSATKETVSVYYELLKDLPADLLKVAALQCCAEAGRKFAPSVGELRGAAAEITHKTQGIPSALQAWNEVCKAPRSGEYRRITDEHDEHGNIIVQVRKLQWSHPVVEKVAKLLGWPRFPDPDNESIDRAHFLKQYELEVERATSAAVELPEVTRYIEANKAQALEAGEAVKRLTGGMTK